MKSVPLRRKVTAVILAAIFCTMVFGGVAVALYEHSIYQQRIEYQLTTLALTADATLVLALDRNDKDLAAATLGNLHTNPGIINLALYSETKDGKLTTFHEIRPKSLGTSFPEAPQKPGLHLAGKRALFAWTLANEKRRLGLFQVEVDLPTYDQGVFHTLKKVAPVALLLIVMGIVFARILQHLITKPLLSLVSTAERIRENNDYSLRADILSDDEVGHLAKAWNQMMQGIQERDANLAQLNRELEERVTARTNELKTRLDEIEQLMDELKKSQQASERAAASLQESNARLTSANIELEAYSYSISHDLKAPLRNLRGFVDLIGERPSAKADHELEEQLHIIAEEADKMSVMIEGLLSFSRASNESLRFQEVSLNELVSSVRKELEHETQHRQIIWRIASLPTVWGDRAALRQVIFHLLHNAIKFTRNRSPAIIEIGTPQTTATANNVTVFVRDNGAGFNPKYSGQLFRVFQRLHSQRDFEGTGIGLASVKHIVTRHNGKVWAEGQVDQGAAFFVTLRRPPENWRQS